MEITQLGTIWLVLMALCVLAPIRYAAALVVVSSIFQAASLVNLGAKGVSLFFASQLFFLMRTIPLMTSWSIPKWAVVALSLCLYAATTAIFDPVLFQGVHVFVPDQGVDTAVATGGAPLQRRPGQIIQVIYLWVNVATIIFFYRLGRISDWGFIVKSFVISLVAVSIIGLWEFSSKLLGVFFPTDFFYSNSGFSQLSDQLVLGIDRLNSTYSEPSYAGAVLGALFWMVVSMPSISIILSGISALAMMLTLSGTGAVAFAAGAGMRLFSGKGGIAVILIGCCLVVLVVAGGFFDYFTEFILNKTKTGSAETRFTSDAYSISLAVQTYGLGTGLGSHRPSSLVAYLLANIGVIGMALWTWFMFLLIKRASRCFKGDSANAGKKQALVIYVLVLLAAQAVAIPDINFMSTWGVLCVVAMMIGSDSARNKTDDVYQ